MSRRPAGEIVPGREVVALFRASEDHLAVVSPLLATYHARARGTLSVSLHRAKQSRRLPWADRAGFRLQESLAAFTAAGTELLDNAPADLLVPPLADSAAQLFALRLHATGAARGRAATVWLSDGPERIAGHVACYVGGEPQGAFGPIAELFYAPPEAPTTVPRGILYSPLTQCNLNCIHCISRDTRATVQRLPQAIRARLQAWAREGRLEFMTTDYSGDILWADTRYPGELDFLLSLGVPFHIDTNGACLTTAVSERLIASRLASINISLDAATEASYRRIRRGAPPLHVVADNISMLVAAHARAGAGFRISMGFTLMRSTLDEWPDFIRMAHRLGVTLIYARHLEAYTADMDVESLWHDQDRYNAAYGAAMAVADELGILLGAPLPFAGGPTSTGHRPCPEPWRSAVILGNGEVHACCVPGMKMGSLLEKSLEEIWNGPAYARLRRTVNSATPPAPCNACPMYRKPNNPDSYLFHRARTAP